MFPASSSLILTPSFHLPFDCLPLRQNTGGNNNNQGSGKWGFVGNPPAAPAMISVDAGGSYGPLQCGQQFTVTNIGHPDTTFTFQNGASVTIHTSCSQPLQAGDQFGSLLVIGSNNCNGPAPPPPCVQRPEDCNSNCDVCVSKSYAPTLMTFTLTGAFCVHSLILSFLVLLFP
jgi:hypothetical protein